MVAIRVSKVYIWPYTVAVRDVASNLDAARQSSYDEGA